MVWGAVLWTVITVLLYYSAAVYWRRPERGSEAPAHRVIIFRDPWLQKCLVRAQPTAAISATFLTLSMWAYLVNGEASIAVPVSLLAAFLVTAALSVVVLYFNVPACLVAPHDRGKPGALALRRRHRDRLQ